MTRTRALYYRPCRKSAVFTGRKDVGRGKRLAAEFDPLEPDWEVLRKRSWVQPEIGAPVGKTKKCALDR